MFPCSQHIIYKVICINAFESYLNRFQNVKAVFIGLWMLSIDSKSYARALSTVFALHAKKKKSFESHPRMPVVAVPSSNSGPTE